MTDSASEMWSAFVESGLAEVTPGANYSSWHFGTGGKMADDLVQLVLDGGKRATAGALWSYEAEGDHIPQVGEYSVITDGRGRARCVIMTVSVEVIPFCEVSAEFAAAEGEGDLSLEYWRDGHWKYFTEDLKTWGLSPERTMPVVCERFEVVFPADIAASGAGAPS